MKTILALTLLAMAPVSRAQDQLADALRKGIVEEDVNHNPGAAIQNYQSALSRYGEERTAAATALFRMAECYRKLGKSTEAKDAYNRLVAEFADQTALVAKSRQQLGVSFLALPVAGGVNVGPTDSAEARRRYRAALQEKVDMAYQHLNAVNKRLELGAAGPSDGTDAAMASIHAQRELAAFDAGLSGPQTPETRQTPAALQARQRIRALLMREIDLAEDAVAREQKKFEAGTGVTQDFNQRRTAVLNLQQELAVLDALLSQSAPTPKKK